MKKTIAVFLAFIIVFSLVGCNNKQSLSAEQIKSLVDTSYLNGIVFEQNDSPSKQNLAPFEQIDRENSYNAEDGNGSLLDHFSMLSKFKGDRSKSTVYVNGQKYNTGEAITLSVLILSDDKDLSVWPTIAFIKQGEENSVNIYNSIRLNTDSLRVPHFIDKDEDAEFGDGYFAYSVFLRSDEENFVDCSESPKELFSIDVAFHSAGHYTVAVVDSYKNNGKYSKSLFLSGNF